MNTPDVKLYLNELTIVVTPQSCEDLNLFVRMAALRWAKVERDAGFLLQ
jgi:hypothetical protein